MDWVQAAPDFAADGSSRDIYVLNASLADWQVVLDDLRRTGTALRYFKSGVRTALPARAEQIFDPGVSGMQTMSLPVGDIVVHCHFFRIDEIEFDLNPSDVHGASQLEALVGFMRRLGELTGKCVVLTRENLKDSVILRYQPDAQTP
jgi:hypothetical protein